MKDHTPEGGTWIIIWKFHIIGLPFNQKKKKKKKKKHLMNQSGIINKVTKRWTEMKYWLKGTKNLVKYFYINLE